jgi:hypothetical protein
MLLRSSVYNLFNSSVNLIPFVFIFLENYWIIFLRFWRLSKSCSNFLFLSWGMLELLLIFILRNVRPPSSIILVFIWKDINVIKNKNKKLYPCHPEGHKCNFFYYIYIIPDGYQKNTRRNSDIHFFLSFMSSSLYLLFKFCHFFFFLKFWMESIKLEIWLPINIKKRKKRKK